MTESKINKIYNMDCLDCMAYMCKNNIKADIVLTSPPYNASRGVNTELALATGQRKYDLYTDSKTRAEYGAWLSEVFNSLDSCLAENGVILLNISYDNDTHSDCPGLDGLIHTLSDISNSTPFIFVDKIIWKKERSLPNNTSPNKLTRITEDVYVLSRKSEVSNYRVNKPKAGFSKRTGQAYYKSVLNYIEAKNNDGKNDLNNATYSIELCEKLLSLFAPEDGLVYDPFMGTGTTAIACVNLGLDYIGSEISASQCTFAKNRLANRLGDWKAVQKPQKHKNGQMTLLDMLAQ